MATKDRILNTGDAAINFSPKRILIIIVGYENIKTDVGTDTNITILEIMLNVFFIKFLLFRENISVIIGNKIGVIEPTNIHKIRDVGMAT